MKKGMIVMIDFYKNHLSGLKKAPTCKYTPTCSEYTKEAIQMYGPLKGGLMGAWRIMRCNPFSRGGFDPVPWPEEEKK